MTDMTSAIQKPTLVGVSPTYTACTATDKFTAQPGMKYMLHYKNGATPTGAASFKVTDQVNAASAPAAASLAAGWADAVVQSAGMAANTELVAWIDNSTRFRDNTGAINLAHNGTLTTVSVAIFGPY